jgi:hypothetical protein
MIVVQFDELNSYVRKFRVEPIEKTIGSPAKYKSMQMVYASLSEPTSGKTYSGAYASASIA